MKNAVQVKELFEAHLRGLELGQGSPSREFYEPMRYILALKAKRIRPVLALLSYQAVTGRDPAEAVNIGLTIEIFHNFTLVHDDIMGQCPSKTWPTFHSCEMGPQYCHTCRRRNVCAFHHVPNSRFSP